MLLKNIKRKRVKVRKIFKVKTEKGHEAVASRKKYMRSIAI